MSSINFRAALAAFGAAVIAVLAGCASSGGVERWHNTEQRAPTAVTAQAAPTQAVKAVFFRADEEGAASRQPINLYLDGHYHASLVGNTYTVKTLCPGAHRVAAHVNDVKQRYVTKTQGEPLTLGKQPTQYFRVDADATGRAAVMPVSAANATVVSNLRQLQVHTVSRVVSKACNAS